MTFKSLLILLCLSVCACEVPPSVVYLSVYLSIYVSGRYIYIYEGGCPFPSTHQWSVRACHIVCIDLCVCVHVIHTARAILIVPTICIMVLISV